MNDMWDNIFGLALAFIAWVMMWREMRRADALAKFYRDDRDTRQAIVLRWVIEGAIHKNLSRKAQAEALRAVAKEYDSPTGKHRLAVVARTAEQGGPSVPALWLLATADVLDPPVEDDHSDHDHTYGGTCIQ